MKHNHFLNINSDFHEDNENTLICLKKMEKNKIFLDRMRKIAEENEGVLVSTQWSGSAAKYQFKDKQEITFSIKYSHLIDRGWPKNVEKFLTLSEAFKLDKGEFLQKLSEIALQHDAKLLSTQWLTK